VNTEEKVALLAQGEQTLEMLEGIFDRFLQEGRFNPACNMGEQYVGAVTMLKGLGLITAKESNDRAGALSERYRDVKYPSRSKEAV